MYNKKLIKISFQNSLAVLIYVGAISLIMMNGDKIFGEMAGYLAPVAFLLLFVISAAITGSLVLGRPAMIFFDGNKKEAISLLFHTVAWLLCYLILIFFFLFLMQ
ncbi:MAG: hypothetical protein ABIA02_00550 [Candidatus Falkowbacteria bacterium]